MDKKHLKYLGIGAAALALLYWWIKQSPATNLPGWLRWINAVPAGPSAAGGTNNQTSNPQPGAIGTGSAGIPPAPSASASNVPNFITDPSQGTNVAPNPN